MVCARPYLLGVGRQAGREPLSQSLLCLPAAGPQESTLLPSCPTKSLPSTTPGATHTGTSALPLQLGASSGQGCPVEPNRGHQANSSKRGSQGGNHGPVASGLWPMSGSLSGEVLAGWIQATSEAALIGEAVTVWGCGEPRASQPGTALSWAAHPGVWPCALAFWAVRPQLWPPCSCIQASAASGAQTPRAISAPELLIFLKRLAALTAMKFFWGVVERDPSQPQGSRVSPKVSFTAGGPDAREGAVLKMATGGAMTASSRIPSFHRFVSQTRGLSRCSQ